MVASAIRESRRLKRARERVDSDISERQLEGAATEPQDEELGDPKGMSWMITSLFLFAETTSLGVLGLALAVKEVGLVPGVILINTLYLLLWYTGMVVYWFKMQNFHIRSFADGVALFFGPGGYWIGIILMVCYLVFVMAAHIVGFSMMSYTIWESDLCSELYKLFACLFYLICTISRRFNAGKYTYTGSCLSILAAAVIAMVGVGLYPPEENNRHAFPPAGTTSLAAGAESVSYIIVATMAHIAYPTIIGEMKKPRDFPKALAYQQVVTLILANLVAVYFYIMGGKNNDSPALSAVRAHPKITKTAWGIAWPSIIITGVIAAMIAAKVLYQILWRRKLDSIKDQRTWKTLGSWYMITFALSFVAFIIAYLVPFFNQLFSLMGSLFGTGFAMTFPALFWFKMNWQCIPIEGRRKPRVRQGEDAAREAEEVQKEACTRVKRAETNSSTTSDQTDLSSTRIVLSEVQPKRSISRLMHEFVLTVRNRPGFATLNLAIMMGGVAMCGLGTYGAMIGILNASVETSFSC